MVALNGVAVDAAFSQVTVPSGPAASAAPRTTAGAARETTARAVRTATPPVIDGRDDDAGWATAPRLTDFRQFDPGENLDPSFRSEARVLFDDRYLYVLVRAFDPHPDSIVTLLSRRDVKTASDQLKIVIDAFHDGRTGVEMAVNPAGVKRDYSIYSDGIEDQTWDGVWDAATRIDALGWIAEFRVPFSQLRFNPMAEHTFGFGIWRDIARFSERDAWPVYRLSKSGVISQLGTLTGITGIAPVTRLELLPYGVAKNASEPTATGARSVNHGTVGLDIKAGLTSNVTVDATINPDFGQVEADPAVLNLSAFEIRFDERRPFFQEGAGLYRCSGPCEGIFYTRRIGRTPQLRASANDPWFTPIVGAAKLTGRFTDGTAIGIVETVTDRVIGSNGTTIEPRSNYLVLRGVREFDRGLSQFGFEITDVRRALDAATEPYLRRSATMAVLQGYTRLFSDDWRAMMYAGVNHVDGSRSAIALTQLGSVHYFQRPDGDEHFDSTRTALGGYVIGGELTKLAGRVRYDGFYRYATGGIEANDFGFVTLVNDVSARHQIDFLQLTPTDWFRSAFTSLALDSHWTTGGLPTSEVFQARSSMVLPNYWGGIVTYTLSEFGGTSCVSCARGGPALRQSPKHGIRLDLTPDPRLKLLPHAALRAGTSDEGRSSYRGGDLGADLRVASRFSASLGGSFDHVVNDQQWVANYGDPLRDSTHYTFARLDQNILAITARINWTATPNLSFQLYGQPFVSTGSYDAWRQLASPHASRYDARFRVYSASAPSGFNVKQFNSNIVVRWEYRPASTLFVVWQQGRLQSDRDLGSFDATRDVSHLFASRPDNTVLVKMSWWLNP